MTERTEATASEQSWRLTRRRAFGLVALFVGLTAVTLVATVVVKGRDLMAGAQMSIQNELSRRLPGATIVGEIDLDGLNRAVFRRVRIEFSPQGGLGATGTGDARLASATLEIDQLVVRFRTVDLLMNRKRPTEAIQSLTAIRPVLTLRTDTDGRWPWDVEDDASDAQVELTELGGTQINVVDGRVVIAHAATAHRTAPVPWVASNIRLEARVPVDGRSLHVESLLAKVFGGSIRARGAVDLSQKIGLDINVQAQGLSVWDVMRTGEPFLNGRLSLDGHLRGRMDRLRAGGHLSFQPTGSVGASSQVGASSRTDASAALGALFARFVWAGDRLELTDVAWPTAGGSVTGRVTVDRLGSMDSSIQAKLSLKDVDAAAFQRFFPGDLSLGGRVSGTVTGGGASGAPDSPAASGQLTWVRPSINGVVGQAVTAKAEYRGGELYVTDASLQLDGVTAHASGKLTRDGRLQATFAAPDVAINQLSRIPQLSRIAKGPAPGDGPMLGRFQVNGTVGGPLKQLRATAQVISVGSVEVGGVPFDKASGILRFVAPGTLAIDKLSLVRTASTFDVSGTVDLRAPYFSRLQMRWQDVPVDVLVGMASHTRTPPSTPTSGEALSNVVEANTDQYMGRIDGVGLLPLWDVRNQANVWRQTLTPQDAWSAQPSPGVSSPGVSPVRRGSRQESPHLSASSPRPAGRTTGEVVLSRSLQDPVIQGSVALKEGSWLDASGARIKRSGAALPDLFGEVAFSLSKGVARIASAEFRQGGGRVKLSGWLEPTSRGTVAIHAEGNSLDVGALLAPWLQPVTVDGEGSLQADLTGTWEDPQLKVAWNMGAGQVDQVNVDGMRLSAVVGREAAHIQELVLYRGPHRAQVQGRLPIAAILEAARRSALAPSGKLDLTIEVPDGPLDLVGALLPGVSILKGRGEIRARVTGSIEQPSVTGEARISGATLAYVGLPGRLSEMDALVRFSGHQVAIVAATAHYAGGTVRLGGTGSLAGPGLLGSKLDLKLTVQDVQVAIAALSGQVSGSLRVGGILGNPLIQGRLGLAKGQFFLGKVAQEPFGWKAGLNVQVESQGDVRILGSGIDVVAGGLIYVGGTAAAPALSGRVDSVRGRFDYLGTEFRLSRGRAEFAEFRGVMPALDVDARASVQGATIMLSLTGPADDLRQSLRSEPEMPESEIIAMLGYPHQVTRFAERPSSRAAEYELVSFLSGALQGQLLGRLEDAVRELLSVDELQIHPGEGLSPAKVEVGKYLRDNLYVTYTHQLQGEMARQNLGFEVRMTPEWRLKASLDDGGDFQLGLQAEWRF